VAALTRDVPFVATAQESGTTPLVTPPPPRRLARRVLAIGARGGRVRASTGYGVPAVLSDTAAIRASLDRHGHPFGLPRDPAWQRALDRVWLRALTTDGAALAPAFVDLLTGAPADSVLRFLGTDARPRDVAAVVRALPPRPFLGPRSTRADPRPTDGTSVIRPSAAHPAGVHHGPDRLPAVVHEPHPPVQGEGVDERQAPPAGRGGSGGRTQHGLVTARVGHRDENVPR
jgi:hypothetical protein